MDRRAFVGAVVCALVASPVAPLAQQRKVWRIGVLINRPGPGVNDEAFLAGMRDLRYVKGQDFVMEYRWGSGQEDRLSVLAAELSRSRWM